MVRFYMYGENTYEKYRSELKIPYLTVNFFSVSEDPDVSDS